MNTECRIELDEEDPFRHRYALVLLCCGGRIPPKDDLPLVRPPTRRIKKPLKGWNDNWDEVGKGLRHSKSCLPSAAWLVRPRLFVPEKRRATEVCLTNHFYI